MPVPTAYTEAQLRTYLVTELSDVGTVLGWTDATTEVQEAVYDTAFALGVSDVADSTDAAAVRALGALMIWRRATRALASRFDFSEDGQSFHRAQLHRHAQAMLTDAERAAMLYDPAYRVGVDTVIHIHDPYAYVPDDVRVLP
jgi:hypothetical protein